MTNWTSITDLERRRIKSMQKWIIVFAVVCEVFLAGDWYGFAAVIPFISKTLALAPAQAGLAQGVFALSYAAGLLFVWSPVSRAMSARTLLLLGLAGTGVGMVLQVFVHSYAELIMLRLVIGFFDAAVWTGNIKLIIGWFPKSQRGAMMGLVLAAYSLAITLDFALGIPLTISFGWRVFFAVLAGGTLIVAVIDGLFARGGPAECGIPGFAWEAEGAGRFVTLKEIIQTKWIAVGCLAIGGCTFALSATATWVVPAFITVQKMPVQLAPVIGTLMGVSQVVFLTIGGYLANRMAKVTLIRIGIGLAALSALSFIVAVSVPLTFAWLLIPAGLSGLSVIGGGAIFSLISEKYPDAVGPAAIGYAEMFGILATFAGPWLLGVAIGKTGSFADAFACFAIVEVILLGVIIGLTRAPAARPVETLLET